MEAVNLAVGPAVIMKLCTEGRQIVRRYVRVGGGRWLLRDKAAPVPRWEYPGGA